MGISWTCYGIHGNFMEYIGFKLWFSLSMLKLFIFCCWFKMVYCDFQCNTSVSINQNLLPGRTCRFARSKARRPTTRPGFDAGSITSKWKDKGHIQKWYSNTYWIIWDIMLAWVAFVLKEGITCARALLLARILGSPARTAPERGAACCSSALISNFGRPHGGFQKWMSCFDYMSISLYIIQL